MADLSKLYREHRIYDPGSDRLALYILLERLSDGKFGVNSVEFLYDCDDLPKRIADIAATTVELMLDGEPQARIEFFETIAEAIDAHEHDFADMEKWITNAQD